ncbi:MlaD family protein [Aldersonia kunmingensis]|uniref:MlaD family protein n=1 Tax=Aldersonia kunmingensis TaxID=408066 RepID=UPI0008378AA5|nr:MlaD family protein [Aldersonia kunmingensis]
MRLQRKHFELGPEVPAPSTQRWWALASVVVLGLVFAVLGALYLRPPGYSTYHAQLVESGGLKPGDGVRISGIVVGKVTALELTDDAVDVTFMVQSRHPLGDQTTMDVRMLTPVGGLYVALQPAGSVPLEEPIPADRVTLPFVVNDLVPKAKELTDQIDVPALRASISGAAGALSNAPDALRNSVADLESVVGVFAEQKNQVEGLLALSNEYLQTVRDNEDLAKEWLQAYAVVGPQLVNSQQQVETFADKVTAVVGLLFDFLAGPYADKVEPLLPPLEQAKEASNDLLERTNTLMDSMAESVTRLAALAGPDGQALVDQSRLTAPRIDVCMPTPGLTC